MLSNIFKKIAGWSKSHSERPASPDVVSRADLVQTAAVGQRVIGCGNEWTPMLLGEVVGIDDRHSALPLVHDWVRGETVLCFSPLIPMTTQAIEFLIPLTPYQRYNLLAGYAEVADTKIRRGADLTEQQYREVLAQHGVAQQ